MSEKKASWWSRLKEGLQKSSDRLTDGMKVLFTHKKLDQATLDRLEDLLISSDIGVHVSEKLVQNLGKKRLEQTISLEEVKALLAESMLQFFDKIDFRLPEPSGEGLMVVLVAGVNGSGKTTTLGKLAHLYQTRGHKVCLAACDTFRAAATEQLQIWGQRLGITVVAAQQGADSPALAFEAIEKAQEEKADILLIDTAGRLHNKEPLMAELEKIVRVLQKKNPAFPQHSFLILDATTGQNAHRQVEIFQKSIPLTGLIMTKLDGTARGGVVLPLMQEFQLPLYALGVGEGLEDFYLFSPKAFVHGLLDLEKN